jgi:hypothetical protein
MLLCFKKIENNYDVQIFKQLVDDSVNKIG